jgi:hypothetical protein
MLASTIAITVKMRWAVVRRSGSRSALDRAKRTGWSSLLRPPEWISDVDEALFERITYELGA